MTVEDWLRAVVEELELRVFQGDLDLLNHAFQIYYGRTKGKKFTETVQPSDVEDISLDDFFPTTIGVNYTIKDPQDIVRHLALECIKAFIGVTKGKAFKKTCERYYFEPPFSESNPSPYLADLIKETYEAVVKRCGEFPGKAVKFPSPKEKEKKINKYTLFCPECGMELTVAKKMFEKHNGALPTCACGVKFARDCSDEAQENVEDQN